MHNLHLVTWQFHCKKKKFFLFFFFRVKSLYVMSKTFSLSEKSFSLNTGENLLRSLPLTREGRTHPAKEEMEEGLEN